MSGVSAQEMNPTTAADSRQEFRFAQFQFDPKVDRLGEGPQCEVFRAVDSRLNRTVALKILRPHVEFDPSAVQRFEREARHTSSLAHPNIATVFEYGQEKGTSYIAMEYLEGSSLEQVLRERSLAFPEGVRVALQVTAALDLVHRNGLIHRDLKPGNIMLLEDGTVKLLDFGICRSVAEPTITQEGMLVGTVLYMSPEQVRGEDLTPASDIFALGSLLYHAMSGELAFPGKTFPEVCMAIMGCNPRKPSEARNGFPSMLEDFLLKCLQPRPEDRYPDAAAAHGALLAVADALQMPSRATKTVNALRGQLFIPPLVNEDGSEHTSQVARGLRADLSSELRRSTNLNVELIDDSEIPADQLGAFVLHGTLETNGSGDSTSQVGILKYVLGRVSGAGADGHAPHVDMLWNEEFTHEDNNEWGLQAQLMGSLSRSVKKRVAEYSLRPIEERARNPELAIELSNKGHSILHCGTSRKLMAAISTLRRAIEADSSCALAHAGLAEALVHKFLYFDGDRTFIDEAIESARRAQTLDPSCAEAHTSLGFASAVTGRIDNAQREYRMAIQLNNDEFLAHRLLGALLAREGNFKTASPLLRRAIALRPTHMGSYEHLYCVLRRLDRYEEALEVADQAISVARDRLTEMPGDQEARTHAAMILARIGLHKDARGWARRALELTPKDGYTLYHCACVFAILGDNEMALSLLRKARDRGYYIQSELVRNSDLDPLRGIPDFQDLLV